MFKDQITALIHQKTAAVTPEPVAAGSNLPTLTLISVPEGVDVQIDGRLMGQTPYTYEPSKAGTVRVRLVMDREGLETQFDVPIHDGEPAIRRPPVVFSTGLLQLKFDRPNLDGDVFLGQVNIGHVPGPQLRLGEGKHDLMVKNAAAGLNLKVPVTVIKNRVNYSTIYTKAKPAEDPDDDGSGSAP